jgi:hypothetical protein
LPGARAYQLAILTTHTSLLIEMDMAHGLFPPFPNTGYLHPNPDEPEFED